MTPQDICVYAALGSLLGAFGLLVFILLMAGLFMIANHLYQLLTAHRRKRRDLAICRAIDALGTTPDPDRPDR
ncbi:hypothetical protein ACF1BS_04435 [Streptomyces sp. NPDC014748]|uniref:hypothetical protein n=1 Tax=Streptomyces sp. NPDC014748 TaxID=3364905 RepID=UPI0036F9F42B